MNAAEYRKQLVIQRIEAHRTRVDMEIQYLKDTNPLQPLIDLGHDVAGVFESLGGMVQSRGKRPKGGGGFLGLDLSLVIPIALEAATHLLRKRKKRR